MKFSKLFLVALGSISLLVSCTNDNNSVSEKPAGAYSQGVFILNEGGSGQGSVSFASDDLTSFTQDVYGAVNGKDLPGQYLQSMFFNGDYAYIISGGSNVIDVVNKNTFKLVAKIETGLKNPRYGVVYNGKAYVTNANTYAYENPDTGNTDDYIAVINLSTNVIESNIQLNATANRIVLNDGKLYITEPFNNDKVLVVNPTTNALATPITIGVGGDTMGINNGILYVLKNDADGTSEIVKVNLADSSTSNLVFPSTLNNANNLVIYDNKVYYTVDASVYAIDVAATSASTTALLSYTSDSPNYAKMYGFAVNNGHIFISDGGDFTANSKAYIYSVSGTLEKEFTVGVGPNGFYFN